MPGPGKPFQPGKSGNPRGRPKGQRPLAEAIRAYGECKDRKTKSTRYKALAKALFDAALTGELVLPSGKKLSVDPETWFDMVKWIGSHGEGQAPQAVQHTGDDGGPIQHTLLITDRPRSQAAPPADDEA